MIIIVCLAITGKKADLKKASGAKSSSVGDRRISAPNTSSSVGSTPQSSPTHQKKRRFSTPVTMSTKDASSPVAHLKKVLKENEMKWGNTLFLEAHEKSVAVV